MIVLDTSVLVGAFTGRRSLGDGLRRTLKSGEIVAVPTLVLFEWLRGPRQEAELRRQNALFPASSCLTFGSDEATVAAGLYRTVVRPRQRQVDLGIAAHALVRDASLWTLNVADFEDLPGLSLHSPA